MQLAVPVIGLLFYGSKTLPEVPVVWRNVVAVLTIVPAVNYVSTLSVMKLLNLERLSFWWQAVTLINGVCLMIALIILVAVAIVRTPRPNRKLEPLSGD